MTEESPDISAVLETLATDLNKYQAPQYRINAQQFFKEKLDKPTAIKTALVRKLAAEHYRTIKGWPTRKVFELCDRLLESELEARRAIAFEWAFRCRNDYQASDFKRFEAWLRAYCDNWAAVDHLCCKPLGHLIHMYPALTKKTGKWTKSRNLWVRRASAVCLIYPLSEGHPLEEAFAVADALMMDEEDMVQKGYGWMLKEAANIHRDRVFRYVLKHKDVMPRTALRYAIEKMPADMRKQAMKRG